MRKYIIAITLIFALSFNLVAFADVNTEIEGIKYEEATNIDYHFFVLPDVMDELEIIVSVENNNPVNVVIYESGILLDKKYINANSEGSFKFHNDAGKLYSYNIKITDAYQLGNKLKCYIKARKGHTYSEWSKEDILFALQNDFLPDSMMTNYAKATSREEFCILLYEAMLGDMNDAVDDYFEDTDVPQIEWLYKLGIVNGTDEKTFNPSKNITRQEAAAILCRAMDFLNIEGQKVADFIYIDDSIIDEWAKNYVYELRGCNVMIGMENRFYPQNNLTKEEAIATVNRIVEMVVKK